MPQVLTCLLALLFSLSSQALEKNSDFRQSSLAQEGRVMAQVARMPSAAQIEFGDRFITPAVDFATMGLANQSSIAFSGQDFYGNTYGARQRWAAGISLPKDALVAVTAFLPTGFGGRTASMAERIAPVVENRFGTMTAKTGTEFVQRAMSRAELAATESSGLLRGGRSGTHYVSDAVNSTAERAQQRLALPQTPEARVTLEVPSGRFSPPSRVPPKYDMPGGGMQRTASGDVPVRILRVGEYCTT